MPSTAALPDPRNADIMIWVGGELLPRSQAKVSVFDSAVQGGDAVWEGLRVYDGGVFRLAAHLDRLEASARALAFERIPPRAEIVAAIAATLAANGMRDGVHIRLTLTRGVKLTSGMSPRWNTAGCTLIVLAEWKLPVSGSGVSARGLRLITSSVRRNAPQCLPSRIHHANLLNNILARLEAEAAGADDAIMLDVLGFVAETNSMNLFLARDGRLETPTAEHCLPGITRAAILELAGCTGLRAAERRIPIEDFRAADEVFCSGTMSELVPVVAIDGHLIGDGHGEHGHGDGAGPVTRRLQAAFARLVAAEREPLLS
jgi:branched-chain amino acid aminotransferase group I